MPTTRPRGRTRTRRSPRFPERLEIPVGLGGQELAESERPPRHGERPLVRQFCKQHGKGRPYQVRVLGKRQVNEKSQQDADVNPPGDHPDVGNRFRLDPGDGH